MEQSAGSTNYFLKLYISLINIETESNMKVYRINIFLLKHLWCIKLYAVCSCRFVCIGFVFPALSGLSDAFIMDLIAMRALVCEFVRIGI